MHLFFDDEYPIDIIRKVERSYILRDRNKRSLSMIIIFEAL